MSSETHPQYWSGTARFRTAIAMACGLSLFIFVYATVHMEIEPLWLFLAAPVPALLWVLVRKFPIALMVALVYVGNFKPHAAMGISVTDPTLIVVVLLYAAVFLKLLLAATGIEDPSLRDLFAGQMLGVTAFFLLVLVIAISYTYTAAPGIGGDRALKLVGFDVLAFVAPLIVLRAERDVRQFVLFSALAGLALAGQTMYRVLHPTGDLLSGNEDPTQIGAGVLMGTAALMVLYFPLATTRAFRALSLGCVAVFTIGTVASLSRGAILWLLFVATASSIFLRLPQGSLSRRSILIAAVAVAILASVSVMWLQHLPATYSKFAAKTGELTRALQGMSTPSGTAGQRFSFAESALQAFLAKPWLGWGVGGWSTLWHYSYERPLTYPHNFVLEVAAEQGMAGLVPLVLVLAAVIGGCTKVLKSSDARLVFIVPVAALGFLCHLTSGSIEDRGLWLWCGTLFAIARMVGQHQQHQAGTWSRLAWEST